MADHSPRDAIALGIGMVHQHFVLVDRFTVTENIILGAEGGPLLDMEAAHAKVAELATRYGFGVRPSALVEELSVGEEQRVEILKALYRGVDLLILDEPTAVLTPRRPMSSSPTSEPARGREDHRVHQPQARRGYRDRRPHHALRRGKIVGEATPSTTSKEKLAEMMVGRPVLFQLEKPDVQLGESVLRLEGLWAAPALRGVDLDVSTG